MARITTRDCERVVPNRYELVLLAAELARGLNQEPAQPLGRKREPKIITALRRIADHEADPSELRVNLWRRKSTLRPLVEENSNDNGPTLAARHSEAQAA